MLPLSGMRSVSLTEGGQFNQRWLADAERTAWLVIRAHLCFAHHRFAALGTALRKPAAVLGLSRG